MRRTLTAITALAGLTLGSHALAWECPEHFAEAREALQKSTEALKKGKDGSSNTPLAHTLHEDAKMLLAGGIANHETPVAGAYDHARAIAKAKAAKAYAETARELAERER